MRSRAPARDEQVFPGADGLGLARVAGQGLEAPGATQQAVVREVAGHGPQGGAGIDPEDHFLAGGK
jgi:hypothetical protein